MDNESLTIRNRFVEQFVRLIVETTEEKLLDSKRLFLRIVGQGGTRGNKIREIAHRRKFRNLKLIPFLVGSIDKLFFSTQVFHISVAFKSLSTKTKGKVSNVAKTHLRFDKTKSRSPLPRQLMLPRTTLLEPRRTVIQQIAEKRNQIALIQEREKARGSKRITLTRVSKPKTVCNEISKSPMRAKLFVNMIKGANILSLTLDIKMRNYKIKVLEILRKLSTSRLSRVIAVYKRRYFMVLERLIGSLLTKQIKTAFRVVNAKRRLPNTCFRNLKKPLVDAYSCLSPIEEVGQAKEGFKYDDLLQLSQSIYFLFNKKRRTLATELWEGILEEGERREKILEGAFILVAILDKLVQSRKQAHLKSLTSSVNSTYHLVDRINGVFINHVMRPTLSYMKVDLPRLLRHNQRMVGRMIALIETIQAKRARQAKREAFLAIQHSTTQVRLGSKSNACIMPIIHKPLRAEQPFISQARARWEPFRSRKLPEVSVDQRFEQSFELIAENGLHFGILFTEKERKSLVEELVETTQSNKSEENYRSVYPGPISVLLPQYSFHKDTIDQFPGLSMIEVKPRQVEIADDDKENNPALANRKVLEPDVSKKCGIIPVKSMFDREAQTWSGGIREGPGFMQSEDSSFQLEEDDSDLLDRLTVVRGSREFSLGNN